MFIVQSLKRQSQMSKEKKEEWKKDQTMKGRRKGKKVKECKTYEGKLQVDYWYCKTKYFICHNVGYIAAKCSEKFSSLSSFSNRKKLYYTQKVTSIPTWRPKLAKY